MKKLILIGIVSLLLIGIAYGALTAFNLIDAVFTSEQTTEPTRYKGNITFNCDGKSMFIYLDEPNLDIDDDFEEEVKKVCNQEITEVRDWTGRKYQQNKNGTRSFDEDILKKDTCSNKDLSYNLTIKECYNVTIVESEIVQTWYHCDDSGLDWQCERFSKYYSLPNGKCWNSIEGNKLCRSGWVLK